MKQDDSVQKIADHYQVWERHKSANQLIAEHYKDSDFGEYHQRIKRCSESIVFQIGSGNLDLDRVWFCRVRHCPICQWRKSLKWKARAYQALPKIIDDFPTARWLFLTLTVKNCPVEDLREQIDWMHRSFKRLTRYKAWSADGWIKSTEVTKGQDGLAHPHFHCLLLVPASYFSGKKYLSHDKWVQLWKKALGIEYQPILDVRAIKPTENIKAVIPEILKYQTKIQDISDDSDWLIQLTTQLYGSRSVAIGGTLSKYFAKGKYVTRPASEAKGFLRLKWHEEARRYLLE